MITGPQIIQSVQNSHSDSRSPFRSEFIFRLQFTSPFRIDVRYFQKNRFFESTIAAMILSATENRIIIRNPHCVKENGIPAAFRFIPYALKIMVGILITIVMTDKTFMTSFRLLEITDANASIILFTIPL